MRQAVRIALDWATRCFGRQHVESIPIRALRVAEEAVELAQACGLQQAEIVDLVRTVYSRPPGDLWQELGGVLVTANTMCAGRGRDPEEVFMQELLRVLAKSPEHFAARNAEKPAPMPHTVRCPRCGTEHKSPTMVGDVPFHVFRIVCSDPFCPHPKGDSNT